MSEGEIFSDVVKPMEEEFRLHFYMEMKLYTQYMFVRVLCFRFVIYMQRNRSTERNQLCHTTNSLLRKLVQESPTYILGYF